MRTDEIVAELRRQRAMRNATWPCVLLKDLMPLCDEYERLRGLISELLDTELGEFADGAGSMAPVEDIIGRMADAVRPNAN